MLTVIEIAIATMDYGRENETGNDAQGRRFKGRSTQTSARPIATFPGAEQACGER